MNCLSMSVIPSSQYIDNSVPISSIFNAKPSTDKFKSECVDAWLSGEYKRTQHLADEKGVNVRTLRYWLQHARA